MTPRPARLATKTVSPFEKDGANGMDKRSGGIGQVGKIGHQASGHGTWSAGSKPVPAFNQVHHDVKIKHDGVNVNFSAAISGGTPVVLCSKSPDETKVDHRYCTRRRAKKYLREEVCKRPIKSPPCKSVSRSTTLFVPGPSSKS